MENILLSFIVPSYKETENDIFPLLTTINNQIGINLKEIEVIIVRDGTNFLNLKQFSYLNINIKQIKLKENAGPGVARQAGMIKAHGKYIMFCDASDMLHNVMIIEHMLNIIEEKNLDILKSHWLEEVYDYDAKRIIYIEHEEENTWLHGKMFKRQFLMDNNINFHPELRIHEDSYFLGVAITYTNKIEVIKTPSYIWRFSFESLTRKNKGEYYFTGAQDFIKSVCMVNHIVKEKQANDLSYRVCQFIMYMYFYMHNPRWNNEYPQLLKETEDYFVEQITPFWDIWKATDKNFLIQLYIQERYRNEYNWIDEETLKQWIERIGLS